MDKIDCDASPKQANYWPNMWHYICLQKSLCGTTESVGFVAFYCVPPSEVINRLDMIIIEVRLVGLLFSGCYFYYKLRSIILGLVDSFFLLYLMEYHANDSCRGFAGACTDMCPNGMALNVGRAVCGGRWWAALLFRWATAYRHWWWNIYANETKTLLNRDELNETRSADA